MQRMFSTFPNAWPGCGLLILRVATSVPIVVIGMTRLGGESSDVLLWVRVISYVSGALLLLGLWTPFAAVSQAVLSGALAFDSGFAPLYFVHALVCMSLVMLGPGYWSIDARLYGRKRIDLNPPTKEAKKRA